jgi:hypothetical protein
MNYLYIQAQRMIEQVLCQNDVGLSRFAAVTRHCGLRSGQRRSCKDGVEHRCAIEEGPGERDGEFFYLNGLSNSASGEPAGGGERVVGALRLRGNLAESMSF